MKSPLAISIAGFRRMISRWGVDAVGANNEGTVSGLFSADRSDPHGMDAFGEENQYSPNRYHFIAVDTAGVLIETHTYAVEGDTYKVVDLDRVLIDDGISVIRATLSKYNR